MNPIEQNELAKEIEETLVAKLAGKTFKAIITIVDEEGNGFSFSMGNLTEKSSFECWRIITSGITEEAEEIVKSFNLPLNTKLKKPIEPK